jgi:hypothetical protein
VQDGLKAGKAAADGKKGPITIAAWLRYAEKRPDEKDPLHAAQSIPLRELLQV